MTHHLLLASALLIAAAAPIAAAPFQWSERVVVVRAQAAGDPALARQRALLLADQEGLRERDLVVFAVLGDGSVEPIFGAAPTRAEARALPGGGRDEGFAVVLIGKDGGVKHRASEPIPADRLYGIIDGMPMRRQEMRDRPKSGG